MNAVEAIADYGHYALAYLTESKGWASEGGVVNGMFQPINAIHNYTAEDLQAVKEAVSGYAITKSDMLANLKVTNAEISLNLDSETSIYFYLTVSDDTITHILPGMSLSYDIPAEKLYRFRTDGIPAHKLDETCTLIYKPETLTFPLVTASPLAYVNAVLSSDAPAFNTEACRNAMIAIYRYYDCAKTYQDEMKRDPDNFNLEGAAAYDGIARTDSYIESFNYDTGSAWGQIPVEKGSKFVILKYQSSSGEILAVVWDNGEDENYSRAYIGQITAYDESSGQYTVTDGNKTAYIIISGGKLSTRYQDSAINEHCTLTENSGPRNALITILSQGYELPQ